jgi:hypothetical protein
MNSKESSRPPETEINSNYTKDSYRLPHETESELIQEKNENESDANKIDSWLDEIYHCTHKVAEMETFGLTRDEIRAIGRRLALTEPFAFESAYGIHDFWLTDADIHEIAVDWLNKDIDSPNWLFSVLQMSNEQIRRALNELNENQKTTVLRTLNIPGTEGVEMLMGQELSVLEKNKTYETNWSPDAEDLRERIRQTPALSAELGQAIAEAYPDRAPMEERRAQTEKQLLKADFRRIQDIGQGTTAPLAAMLEGRDLPAVYKLLSREPGISDPDDALRAGVKPGTGGMREWLAHQIGRIIAPGRVPVTVLRAGPLGEGTLQEWEVGVAIGDTSFVSNAEKDPELRRELIRNSCFDQVVRNSDRHVGNKQINERGKLIDIDNGLILGKRVNALDELRNCALWVVANEKVDDEILAPYDRFLETVRTYRRVKNNEQSRMGNETHAAEKALTGFSALRDRFEKIFKSKADAIEIDRPTDEDLKQARVVEVLKKQFVLALGEDADELFDEFIDNIQELTKERQLNENSDAWYNRDVLFDHAPDYYKK